MSERVYADPNHEGNGAKYHTGKPCIETGCERPAGTWWSPHWCFEHNVERMDRISASLDDIILKRRLEQMVHDATAELRRLVAFYRDRVDCCAQIVWKPLGDLKITDRDVLLTTGSAYRVFTGRWHDERPQHHNPEYKRYAGWYDVSDHRITNDLAWYAEIPPAPREHAKVEEAR
jgi:hypothetical protein